MNAKHTPSNSSLWKILGFAALSLTFLAPTLAGSSHGRHGDHDRHGRSHQGHHAKSHHGDHARSHHGHHASHYYERQRYQRHGPGWTHGKFVTPIHLSRHNNATYRPYLFGSLFYRAHGHHHSVYDFPVYTNHGYVYQRHYYCDGSLFRDPTPYRDSHFQLNVRF